MFSLDIERALRAAHAAHDGQFRKNSDDVPYVVHPIHAAMMLARLGADEPTILAAILHDVVEDCEDWTLERVDEEFGPDVRRIVDDLTEDKSLSWQERKQGAVDHVPNMHPEAAMVKAADKLHNLSSMLADLEEADDPSEVWSHFKGGRDRTIEMASALVEALLPRVHGRLAEALVATVEELRRF